MAEIAETMENAMQSLQAGHFEQAERLYRLVLQTEPDHPVALHCLAVIACQNGRYDLAIELIGEAIEKMPEIPQFYNTFGMALGASGKLKKAIEAYQQAISLKPDYAEAYTAMAFCLKMQGKNAEAIESYKKAIRIKPQSVDAYNNLANILRSENRHDEAIENYRQAIRLKPDFVGAYNNLGNGLNEQGHYAEAIESYKQAIRIKPDFSEAYNNMAVTLILQGNYTAALEKCRQAIQLKPDYAEAYNTTASALMASGCYGEAVENFRKTLELNPDYAEAHSNMGIVFLVTGKFAQGWEEYEWRLRAKNNAGRYCFDKPRWDGSAFTGKKLLVYYEQGMGDSIQFVRYLPMVKERGGTVIFLGRKPVLNLLHGFPGIDELVEASPDANADFDYHVSLMSLPCIFNTTVRTIPAEAPYLYADSNKAQHLAQQLAGANLKVGITWAGSGVHKNDRNRSCTLENFATLAEIDGIQLYGLQKGNGSKQADMSSTEIIVRNLGEEFEDFTDTAAAIENMDLVVSVDTAVLHLAGAMGKPVWALLPFAPDWRWMLKRQDTPWYPTMRLFRQKSPGCWSDLFAGVKKELQVLADKQKVIN